jgi:hypothetical protein
MIGILHAKTIIVFLLVLHIESTHNRLSFKNPEIAFNSVVKQLFFAINGNTI